MQRLFPISLSAVFLLSFSIAAEPSAFEKAVQESGPVAHWSFSKDGDLKVKRNQNKEITDRGPVAPEYPKFGKSNDALRLDGGERVVIPDEGGNSRFDFDNGDAITLEAMINPTKFNGQAAIISKGRTHNPGFPNNNQNWALRLKSVAGQAGVNFLFRSRDHDGKKGDWHRWTTVSGIGVNTGWHHVAVSYEFGKPESIRAFIDGNEVKGTWDMGGPTTAPPVIDNDEIWIGSSTAGSLGNSFIGSLDEIAVYRKTVPAETFLTRYERVEPPMVLPEAEKGVVKVHMHGPLESNVKFPNDPGEPLISWDQKAMGFVRIPRKFDDWGVREDWGTGVLVRAVTEIELEPGEYEFLGRSRTVSRLFVDGKKILDFPKVGRGGGAHNHVQPVPEVPRPGMRPHAMDDVEKIVKFTSKGGTHTVVFDIMVGGPKIRLEFGETCLAIAKGDEIFRILAPGAESGPRLTDEDWIAFTDETGAMLDRFDRENRRAADKQKGYWSKRHELAAEHLAGDAGGNTIDGLILARLETAREHSGDPDSFFNKEVRPIFAEHCYRCHGEKEKGELNLQKQESLLAGGESGIPAVVPGDPHQSFLIELVGPEAGDDKMPPKGDGLSAEQVAILEKWVKDEGGKIQNAALEIADQTPVVDDLTFLRRVWIDTVGVAPPVKEIRAFQSDPSPDKRAKMIERLLADDRWADNQVGYWQDVLAENPNLLKPMLNNTGPFRFWILEALRDNKPMDRFATELITMRGSTWGGGAGGFGVATQNDVPMAAKAHILGTAFLGIDMKCARCHDAPYHETTQEDLFQMAAMLERKEIQVPKTSSVPAAFFDHVEKGGRESLIEVTLPIGAKVQAEWPFDEFASEIPDGVLMDPTDTRERIAADVTFSRRFAEVIVNRMWSRYIGAGIVEPVDDWEGHAPVDPELLAHLTDGFIRGGYDLRKLVSTIMNSKLYQQAAQDLPANIVDSKRFFEAPYRRRMSAEQVVDNAWHIAGKEMDLGLLTMDMEGRLAPNYFLNFGSPQKAWEFSTLANERDRPSLAMPKIQAVVDVLRAFGWRNSRQEPTSHRIEEPNPLQPGVLANGVMGSWMTRLTDDSEITELCIDAESVEWLTDQLYLRFLTRKPTPAERDTFHALLADGFETRLVAEADLAPVPEKKRMPYVSWSNHLHSEANSIKQEEEAMARAGDPPTRYLKAHWREQAEDALWALLNAPEMIMVP
ncbi:DUF1553 domain-containing protein [Verrucomicrobiales bacterium BCK34]|nr:DUF1553 domain-containing protein [Verrucomicrobiales bacterium BCK34]